MRSFRPSRYNFIVRADGDCVAAFNALTGCIARLDGRDSQALSEALLDPELRFSGEEFSPELSVPLHRGGFIVDHDFDELQVIKERYWRARGETPAVLTITTTLDCNLACYYCYEERSTARLTTGDASAIVELAAQILSTSKSHTLHVDWYGGEPLLNHEFLERASEALQSYCRTQGVPYVASIISNGSLWPEDVEDFIARHRIRQAQISFDGLEANHNKRRRYRRGHGSNEQGSFKRVVDVVDRLVNCARVDLRFNIDRRNQSDLLPFIEFARGRGWFDARFPVVFQPARLAAYSQSSSFMRAYELTLEEFDALRAQARRCLDRRHIEESEVPDGFPHPKTSVCAALATHSVVIGAEKLTYRCGLQVGEARRATGMLSSRNAMIAPEVAQNQNWWNTFDPTCAPTCSRCSFLPICWGGCPKKHLEGDQHAIQEQGRYWRNNLPRLIARAAGLTEPMDPIPEKLQFR